MNQPKLFVLACLSCMAFFLGACSGDNTYTYPSALFEFFTIDTDGDGAVESLLLDDGTDLYPTADSYAPSLVADTLVRVVGYYVPQSDGLTAQLLRCAEVLSPMPKTADKFPGGVKTDPLEVESVWKGRGYLNMVLRIYNQGSTHYLHFVQDKVWDVTGQEVDLADAEGDIAVDVVLYHDAAHDQASYADRAYASLPVWPYLTGKVTSVTIDLMVHNYEGKVEEFVYTFAR